MIALNEPNEYAAEVPFTLPLENDPLTGLTGYAFTLGEVQIRLPGAGAWVNVAVAKIVEKGYGRYAARLTSSQVGVAGAVSIYATATGAQPYRGTETIGMTGGDIAIGGTGYLMAYLPNADDPVYGAPASGPFSSLGGFGGGLAGGLAMPLGGSGAGVRVCYQNATYIDVPNTSVVEFGFGLYGIPVTTANTVLRGKIYYYLEAAGYQRFESYSTVLTGLQVADIVPAGPTPVAAPLVLTSPQYFGHVAHALTRLCEFAKAKVSDG